MSEYRFFLLHKILVLSVNVLVLAALTVAMYLASASPEEFTLVFLKVFGGLLVPIFTLAWAGKRWLRRNTMATCAEAA
jgi:hypothetical protein